MTSVWVQTCRDQTLPFGGRVATQVRFRLSGWELRPPAPFFPFSPQDPLRGWGSFLWTTTAGTVDDVGSPFDF